MTKEYKDLLERVVFTFLESFIGAITVAPLVGVNADALQLAAISGGAAALVVVKECSKRKLSK